LSLAGGVSYTGARYAMDGSPFEFKSYYLADFLASYEWGADRLKYSVDLSVKNAFDEKYFLSTASRGDPARASLSFALKY